MRKPQREPSEASRLAEGGFTLLELVISIAICGFMMAIAWSTAAGTARMRKQAEVIQERHHEIRIAMARMVQDLSGAYLSNNQDPNQIERRTLMVGEEESVVDALRFSSFGHRVLWADADESGETLISYLAEDDLEDSQITHLVRRESRRLPDEDWKNEPAEYDVLLHNISRVQFEYWDWQNNDWRKDWDTTTADGQRGRLPTRVKIAITLKDQEDDDVVFQTQASIMMQEQLLF